MAKSAGNFLTVESTIIKKGIDPLAYRYAAFQTHYRNPMEYTQESISAAQNGLKHLQNQVRNIKEPGKTGTVSKEFKDKFLEAINDDLNMPRAMAAVQEMLKSEMSNPDKYAAILDFDQVLGLKLDSVDQQDTVPEEVQKLLDARIKARREKNWAASDQLRDEIAALGYIVQDSREGMKVIRK